MPSVKRHYSAVNYVGETGVPGTARIGVSAGGVAYGVEEREENSTPKET